MNVTQEQIDRAWNGEHMELAPRRHLCKYTEGDNEYLRIFDGRTTIGEAVATRNKKYPDPPKGRGYGKFVEGEPVTRVNQVKVGDLLCEYDRQFNACNLIRVTQTEFALPSDGTNFHAIIVDTKDTSVGGVGVVSEACYWDWEISPIVVPVMSGALSPTFKKVLHRAILDDDNASRYELQASDFKTGVEATHTPEGRKMLESFASRNGARFMLEGTNPTARIIEIVQKRPGVIPLMVEHFIY